jgi:ketosteroid isomerase-like protein
VEQQQQQAIEASAQPLDGQRMLELTRQSYAAWANGDMQGVLNFFSDNVVAQINNPASYQQLPFTGTWVGKARLQDFFNALQQDTIITGVPESISLLPQNRVLVVFKMDVTGRASGATLTSIYAIHIHTFNNNYQSALLRNFIDSETIRAVIDGRIGQTGEGYGDDGY